MVAVLGVREQSFLKINIHTAKERLFLRKFLTQCPYLLNGIVLLNHDFFHCKQRMKRLLHIEEYFHLRLDEGKNCIVKILLPYFHVGAASCSMLGVGRAFEGEIHLVLLRADGTLQFHDCPALCTYKLLPIDVFRFG